ncbi:MULTISPECIES: PP2C family protein-serine/threonine phosphatase [unclassified Streptomyces]|uniref:PP2C family protein-serine/threonine phosphatase n=1 Tax=unclassified Streptomyces TaxID=2593676 RepID=UPI002E7A74FB|nr:MULTISPECIES: SpoIIE family protein phosphatase [unclassified Streptomyces]MEE1761943.1 SpoIIE family protein phosphatase [Streptomyces sp. SP18BB07]MEE1835439.1 SpoIIE family protein phosphatase [Streptomyces sp. SP17KL33]
MPVPVPRQRAIPAVESGQAHAVSAPSGPSGEGAAMNASALAPADNSTNPPGSHAPGPGATGPAPQPGPTNLTVLLIEDDPAGSLNVPELLDSAGKPIRVRTARNLTEAQRLLTDDVNCILLDLALPAPARPTDPDTESADRPDDELAVLKYVLDLAPRHAVLALTDSGDAERGTEAVRVGAQDYLFRDEVDSRLLSRAIRYAVERKRSDTAERRLTESKLRAQENARLERGLLPTPLLEGSSLRFAARYRPGRSRALLGGDFYDTVRTPDGTVHVMIGDVCGHGPDEAALGVELRIAWRALTFAGLCGDELLSTLQRVLEHERESDEIFATLCTVDIAPDGRRAGLCLAGHPSPLIARHGQGGRPTPPAELLPYDNGGPALGLLPNARWPRTQIELGAAWSLMLYTDGLIEGRIGQGKERLGQDGMVEMVRRQLAEGLRGEELLRAAVNEVRDLNGGELTDDVAVLLLDREA